MFLFHIADEGQLIKPGINFVFKKDWWRIVIRYSKNKQFYMRHRNKVMGIKPTWILRNEVREK